MQLIQTIRIRDKLSSRSLISLMKFRGNFGIHIVRRVNKITEVIEPTCYN